MKNLIRMAGLAFCAALVSTPQVQAQTKDIVEIFGGVDFTNTTPEPVVPKANLTGFVVGVAPFATNWFGPAFELSKQYGTVGSGAGTYANANLHESTYLAGPQFRFLNIPHLNMTAKALLGGVQGQVFQPGSQESQTRFALMLGVGVDVGITKLVALRIEPGFYRTSFSGQNQDAFRISIGPVLRLGTRE
jgi:hypothetical protein